MAIQGYIKLYRQIQECWLWFDDEKFTKGQAWVDLLLLANHKDKRMSFKEQIITIRRGQFVTSIAKLSERWGWSFNTTKKFLNLLESDNMLIRKSDNKKTLITIVNYEIYQSRDDEKITELDSQADRLTDSQADSQADSLGASKLIVKLTPNKNDKNIKNEKNEKNERRESVTIESCREVIQLFNAITDSFPKVEAETGARIRTLKTRLKKYSVDDFNRAFHMAEESDFLSGRNGKWDGCSFDWIIKEANLVKILEGNYDNKTKSKASSSSNKDIQDWINGTTHNEEEGGIIDGSFNIL